jgi:hypothetical protein
LEYNPPIQNFKMLENKISIRLHALHLEVSLKARIAEEESKQRGEAINHGQKINGKIKLID